MSQLEVNLGDHWAILGATGSGKTTFVRQLIRFYANASAGLVPIYLIDSKMQGDFTHFQQKSLGRTVKGNEIPKPIKDTKGKPYLVWQPETDDREMYGEFFEGLYYHSRKSKKWTPAVVLIDELSSITEGKQNAPSSLEKLWKQGRGMGISVITLTQSPSKVPHSLLRQTMHIVRMHLNGAYDPKKMSEFMGKVANDEPEDDYGFFYRHCAKPIRKSPVQYFEDKDSFFGGGE